MEFVSGQAFFRGSPVDHQTWAKDMAVARTRGALTKEDSIFLGENFSRPFQSPYQSVLQIHPPKRKSFI